MAVTQRMELRQSQSLVMTPQLQQAIKLLELSNLELSAYVEQELEQNPLLERDEGERDAGEAERDEGEREDARDQAGLGADAPGETPAAAPELADATEFAGAEALASATQSTFDTDYDNLWNDDNAGSPSLRDWRATGGRPDFADDEFGLEQTLTREVSLREHLLSQIGADLADPTDRVIGLHLVELLDDAGYMVGDLAPVAQRLGCSVARVAATLEKMQRFDPPGIFARNLAECLALQLHDRNRLDPAMRKLLDNLDLLARGDRAALMRLCGVDADDLAEMAVEIRALDPKPALAFDRTPLPPVTPDILMHRHPDGGWIVELNADTLPRVLVNSSYHARISRETKDKTVRNYIAERFNSANWLVKSLHQRATTILKVATEIVRQQEAFFLHGVQHLKPLIRRDIAEAIGMHESTISRVTTNKYLASPRGLYELRYFFTASIAHSDGGAAHSAEAVRSRLKALIDSELPGDILSDDRLVELLARDGIEIARRTVAKYRESMRIPSSVQRRRDKSLRI